jgi:uncharacterized protein (DUF58 family)
MASHALYEPPAKGETEKARDHERKSRFPLAKNCRYLRVLRLTRTGKIFLLVIVVMQFASITSQSGLLVWVVGLITGCLIVNAIGAFRSVRKVRLRVQNRMLIEEGSAPREPWQVVNAGKRRARLITVECHNRVWFSVAEAPAGQTVAAAPRDVFKQRGVYALADAWLVSLYPFGLIKAMHDTECDAEVLVFPKLYATAVPEVRGLDPMLGGRHTGPGRIAAGEKFAGVRPIQSGDSYKQIHWKSSAKGAGLMVKSFEEELAGRASLLVFCEKASPHAEACIRAAGSIAHAGVEGGHQIDFQNLNEGRRVRVQPFGDNSRLLEELARYSVPSGDLTAEAIEAAVANVPKRSALHFVLTGISSTLEAEIRKLLAARKLVILHLPPGTRVNVDCPVHHFPVS